MALAVSRTHCATFTLPSIWVALNDASFDTPTLYAAAIPTRGEPIHQTDHREPITVNQFILKAAILEPRGEQVSNNTAHTDSQTTTDKEWTYTSMAPEVGAYLRGRKNNLESIPMFLGASTAKWNTKQIVVDGKRVRVNYVATNPRADVRAFVEAALAHAEKDVPTTDKGLADAFTKGVMRKYAKHLAAQRNLNASINAAHAGKAWFAEGISRPFTDQFTAAKEWHKDQNGPTWWEAFVQRRPVKKGGKVVKDENGNTVYEVIKDADGKTTSVKNRRKKIIAAANTWQGNADGTTTKTVKTRNGGTKTVKKAEARKPKQVTKANMLKALKGAGLEVNPKEKVDQVRVRYQGAIACGIITGGTA